MIIISLVIAPDDDYSPARTGQYTWRVDVRSREAQPKSHAGHEGAEGDEEEHSQEGDERHAGHEGAEGDEEEHSQAGHEGDEEMIPAMKVTKK